MRVLLVEDEAQLSAAVAGYLRGAGTACDVAATFGEGMELALLHPYDCVLLDLTLPGGDGLDILLALKRERPDAGAIVLTARGGLEDRLRGLDLGADDYLPKPFHLAELAARLRAVHRRRVGGGRNILQSGALAIDLDAYTATVAGTEVPLTRSEYQLLEILVGNEGRLVTKDVLASHLWGPDADHRDSLDTLYAHLKNLRRKLAQAGCPDLLQSVYGMGYKWAAA